MPDALSHCAQSTPDARTDGVDAAVAQWLPVLDSLEAELVTTDDEATGDEAPWSAPSRLPPLPAALYERAAALNARQLQRASELDAHRLRILQHLSAVSSVPSSSEPAASVYLDTSG